MIRRLPPQSRSAFVPLFVVPGCPVRVERLTGVVLKEYGDGAWEGTHCGDHPQRLCERQSTPGSLNEEEWNPSRWKALALLPLEVARTRIGQRRAAVMDE